VDTGGAADVWPIATDARKQVARTDSITAVVFRPNFFYEFSTGRRQGLPLETRRRASRLKALLTGPINQ
jgi:hypothetical protein